MIYKPMRVDEFLQHVVLWTLLTLLIFGMWPFEKQPSVNSESVLAELGNK